jgi:8-oxo-dGTP diphosphatase
MWYRLAEIDFNKLIQDRVLVSTCIVFKNNNGKIQVLLERRGTSPEKHKWCIPGGHLEAHESPEQAAIRELKEECNIDLSDCNLIYIDKHDNEINRDKFNFIYATKYNGDDNVKAGSDAEYIEWIDIDKMPNLVWNNKSYINKAKKIIFDK